MAGIPGEAIPHTSCQALRVWQEFRLELHSEKLYFLRKRRFEADHAPKSGGFPLVVDKKVYFNGHIRVCTTSSFVFNIQQTE